MDIVEDVTTSKILWFAPWMILGILMGLVCLCVIPEIMMLWFVYGFSLLVIDEKRKKKKKEKRKKKKKEKRKKKKKKKKEKEKKI